MRLRFLAALAMTLLAQTALAADVARLSEGALMARCYAHLTGRKIPATHPLLINTLQTNQRANTIANCLKVFDKARLAPASAAAIAPGYPTTSELADISDVESLRVLNQFYAFYSLFFEEQDFQNRPQTYSNFVEEQWDSAEDALFYLRATFEGPAASGSFTPMQPFNSILRSDRSLSGRRILPQKYVRQTDICVGSSTGCWHTPTSLHNSIQLRDWFDLPNFNDEGGLGTSSGLGYLTGIKVWPKDSATMYGLDGGEFDPDARTGRDHKRARGGGLLGTSSYLLKNGQYVDRRSGSAAAGNLTWAANQDGGVHNRRRMIKNLFSATLCRDQPPLRMDDDVVLQRVKNYQDQNYAKNKTIAFRESQLCASCHVAYDEAAAVLRNTGVTTGVNDWDLNADGDGSDNNTFAFAHRLTTEKLAPAPHLTHPWNNNTWGTTKPTGALHFRDFRGNYVYVDIPASRDGVELQDRGIQELGEAISNTDQFYACFAKRMFFFFTGIDVSLEDHGDSRLEPLPAAEKHYRDKYIVPLAIGGAGRDGLKQHQSVRRLISDILSLDLYGNVNLRDHHE